MKKIIIIICVFLLTGCSLFEINDNSEEEIYTTTYPTKFLIDYLYGTKSSIYSIYPSGVDFKEYELSDKKINEYSKSNLFVFNSQDIERDYAVKMININSELKLIDVALNMKQNKEVEELWLNPYNYLMMAKNTKDSLAEYIKDPYINQEIDNKYSTLEYELSKLDARYQESLTNAKYKVIVSDKDLFKYLEKYNISVISLEEDIVSITIKENDTLSEISTKYGVSISDILTYNNKTKEHITTGETIKVPIKTIDSSDIDKVKKLISEKQISYIYSDGSQTNDTIKSLVDEFKLEIINFNTMYSIDGGITNTNDNYMTIMANNLELLEKELYK